MRWDGQADWWGCFHNTEKLLRSFLLRRMSSFRDVGCWGWGWVELLRAFTKYELACYQVVSFSMILHSSVGEIFMFTIFKLGMTCMRRTFPYFDSRSSV